MNIHAPVATALPGREQPTAPLGAALFAASESLAPHVLFWGLESSAKSARDLGEIRTSISPLLQNIVSQPARSSSQTNKVVASP